MKKIIIVATARNYIIGKDGQIPWHSKADLRHFKNTTLGSPILMGRKTFESLGKPLKGRLNIVITRNLKLKEEFSELMIFENLEKAYGYCESEKLEKIFIIGGGQIYAESLKDADEMVVSHMEFDAEGDTYFPEIKPSEWTLFSEEREDEFIIRRYKRN